MARRRFSALDAPATTVIVALTVLVWLAQLATGGVNGPVTNALLFNPGLVAAEPWRLVTTMLVHGGILHIGFNMWAVWVFGRILEQMLGSWRFVALYVISGIVGSMAVTLIAPQTSVIGASGAIFGLFACFFVLQHSLGGNAVQILVVIALNLVIGFIVPGIAWQAHVGGIVGGFVTGFIFARTRSLRRRNLQVALLVAEAVVAVIVAYAGYSLYY